MKRLPEEIEAAKDIVYSHKYADNRCNDFLLSTGMHSLKTKHHFSIQSRNYIPQTLI